MHLIPCSSHSSGVGGNHEHVRCLQERWRYASYLSRTKPSLSSPLLGYELVTPPLDGMILPGITRDSVLSLARDHASGQNKLSELSDKLTVSERRVTMKEIKFASENGSLAELFGAGMYASTSSDKC